MNKYFISGILAIGFITSCRHDSRLDNLPAVTFSKDIKPILQRSCSLPGCHSSNGNEFTLLTYEDVVEKVKPGDAHSSELYRAVAHRSEEIMPPPPATLTESDIGKIYVWIETGAKNN